MARKKLTGIAGVSFVRGPLHGISEYRLDNGLKVLLLPDHSSPVVTSLVVYKVGSRNEGPGNTGSAHFFEHLMFKGSKRFNPDNGLNIDEITKEIGAGLNAYTSYDQTVYHEQVSSEYLELCLAIEADRMRGLRMKKADRDSEMTVVRNEMEQGENHPGQAMNKKMWATAFTQHPYHHDVIGSRTEVENVPMENMRDFYNTYYWPNNATLILVGDFETDNALTLVQKHFGKISRSPHKIPTVYTVEPPQEGENRFEIHRAGSLFQLALGFHIPEAVHADIPALQVLSEVLGSSSSRSSRLYKRLVDTGIASTVYAYAMPLRDPSLMEVHVELTDNASLADAESAVLEEIERLKTELVSDVELDRIKAGNRKDTQIRLAESKYLGYQLANAEAVAEWRWLFSSDAAFAAVTAEDIRRVAAKYLTKQNRTVGAFIPKTEEELAAAENDNPIVAPAAVAAKPKKERKRVRKPAAGKLVKTLKRLTGKAPVRKSISSRIVTRVLANGLTVNVLQEKVGSGAVAVGTAVKAGNFFESKDKQNLSDIVASMLPMGSAGLSKEALADELMEMGVRSGLHVHVGPFIAQTSSAVVSADLGRYLGLISTILRQPQFDPAELDKVKLEWTGRYKQEIDYPGSVANNTLGNVAYQPTDVFFQKTLAEQLADLQVITVEDLRAFHSAFYTPSSTIFTVVGDVDPEAAVALFETVFANWTGPVAPAIVVPPVAAPAEQTVVKKMPDKPGVQIVVGRPVSLKKSDPDWNAAVLGLRVLGGDTLTARLGKKLREQGGLTYGVNANQWDNSYGGAPWYISLSVNASNVDPAVKMVREILEDFVANGITEAELSTQVNNMIGTHQLGITTIHELAGKIAEFSALGLSFDGIDNYAAQVRSITLDDVNTAIRKHFAAENLITVIAGGV